MALKGVNPDLIDRISRNATVLKGRIDAAARRSGRSAESIRLVGISKTFGPEYLDAAFTAGVGDLGENRIQEAVTKFPRLQTQPILHMVGHLQSNKAKQAVELFDWIHSVDSARLMDRIGRITGEIGKEINVLIQVDLAGEATKSGVSEEEIPAILEAAEPWPTVSPCGLMCLPPFFDDPEKTRPYFERARQILQGLRTKGLVPDSFDHLSMGMSNDFEVAVEEGATLIRVGTALFGTRSR
ncbi:YggS family pyridoxal phosphate-dependent enzyme [Acidobacteriota bacterium]